MAENSAETHRNITFNNNVTMELAAKPGLLYPLVGKTESFSGSKMARIENRFDEMEMVEKVTRNDDTKAQDQDSIARFIKVGKSYDLAKLIDPDDMMVTEVDLKSPAVMGAAKAARRYHDDEWLVGYFGNAWSGEAGETAVPFDTNNVIAHGSAGLTLAKLIDMQEMMALNDVDIEEEQPILLLTPKQKSDLLGISEYKNADFNESRPLVRGELKPFMGFRFIQFNPDSTRGYRRGGILTKPSGSTRKLPCFVPSGLTRGVWTEFYGKVSERNDKSHSEQIYARARSAVVRNDEAKCYLLECTES